MVYSLELLLEHGNVLLIPISLDMLNRHAHSKVILLRPFISAYLDATRCRSKHCVVSSAKQFYCKSIYSSFLAREKGGKFWYINIISEIVLNPKQHPHEGAGCQWHKWRNIMGCAHYLRKVAFFLCERARLEQWTVLHSNHKSHHHHIACAKGSKQ